MSHSLQRSLAATRDPHNCGRLRGDMRSLGYLVNRGRCFPVREGGVALLRRPLYTSPGDWYFCGWAEIDGTTIRNRANYAHGANTAWQYAAVRVLGNGWQSDVAHVIRVDFDSEGALIDDMPMWPLEVTAEPISGGQVTIRWLYDHFGEGGPPAAFYIYDGIDKDNISYVGNIGSVTTMRVDGIYEFTTNKTPYADGVTRAFAVRARSASAHNEENLYTTDTITIVNASPADATIRSATPRRNFGGRRR